MAVVMVVVQILVSLTSVSVSAAVDFEHVHLHSTRAPPTKAVAENKHALTLFHRDTVTGRTRNHTTHRDRLNERLNRDARRVATLTRRLSTTTRASNNYQVEDFASEVVSGLEEGSGEYFVRIGVGSPATNQYMVIDSGSDIGWVQCKPCKECYAQSDPVFDPAESSSFAGVACGSTVCGFLRKSGCSAGRCRYEVSYGDGSYTKGTLALETLTFGPTTVRDVAIGCGHRNRGLFVGAAGLLGLGRGPMSFVGQIGAQLGDAFAYCLVSRGGGGGSLVFGRDSAVPIGAVWVPLLQSPRAPSFYYVGLVGLGVGGTRLPIPESGFAWSDDGDGGVVLDTGTAVTRFPSPVYEALRDAFVSSTMGLPRAHGPSIFDTCYDLSGFRSVRVPTVSFYFDEGPILTLPARNFMIPVDGMGTYCFAFAASESELSIIGNIQQEGIQISFDVANNLVGFGPYTC